MIYSFQFDDTNFDNHNSRNFKKKIVHLDLLFHLVLDRYTNDFWQKKALNDNAKGRSEKVKNHFLSGLYDLDLDE